MSNPSQVLPAKVWTSKVLPPPKTADALSQISHFLSELGYSKTVKALAKEATSNDITVKQDFTPDPSLGPFGLALGDLYVDAFLNEEDDSDDESDEDDEASEDSDDEVAGAVKEDSSESGDSGSSDSSDSDSSESEDEEPAKKTKVEQVKKETVTSTKRKREASPESSDSDSSSDTSSGSESDSDDSDSSVEPPKKRAKNETLVGVSPDSDSDSESSEDESEDESKATSVSDSSSDSSDTDSSDDDTEVEAKTKKSAKKTSTILGKVADTLGNVSGALGRKQSDSTESEQSSATLIASPQETSTPASTMHPARQQRLDNSANNKFNSDKKVKNNVPFSRIPKDTKVDPRFASNDYVSYDYADRAYQDLSVTKGKGFTKEKNKKKRGSYRGGVIDVTPKGIKFDD